MFSCIEIVAADQPALEPFMFPSFQVCQYINRELLSIQLVEKAQVLLKTLI